MTKKEKSQIKSRIKSLEAVCKMLDHCSIPYSGFKVYLQGVTYREKRPYMGGAMLISAIAAPVAEITDVNGKTHSYPIALRQ